MARMYFMRHAAELVTLHDYALRKKEKRKVKEKQATKELEKVAKLAAKDWPREVELEREAKKEPGAFGSESISGGRAG